MRASCPAFCKSRRRNISLEKEGHRFQGVARKRPATASGCGGAGSSAASPLLPDAQWHRLRRGSLHPAPRRSQRRLTPFFSSLLGNFEGRILKFEFEDSPSDPFPILVRRDCPVARLVRPPPLRLRRGAGT